MSRVVAERGGGGGPAANVTENIATQPKRKKPDLPWMLSLAGIAVLVWFVVLRWSSMVSSSS